MRSSLNLGVILALAAAASANAQFKVVGPAPYSDAVARQKIKTLLGQIDPPQRQQTLDTINGLLTWYRDILDEELIAAWQKGDGRENLAALMKPLADARLAGAVVEFSWRQQREATFTLPNAPLFVDLMTRSPDSAKPFMDDLQGSVNLSPLETEAACRILLDLPDIRTWRKNALRILPRYRPVAESLLSQDLRSSDIEKRNAAQVWMNDLGFNPPGPAVGQNSQRNPRRAPQPVLTGRNDSAPGGPLWPPAGALDASKQTAVDSNSAPVVSRPTLALSTSGSTPVSVNVGPAEPRPYDGPRSGTFECTNGPIAQNAEYVFRNVPMVKLQLEYDTKVWDARLVPGEGQSQRLILKNKSSGPQKRCLVHWTAIP